MEEHKHNQWVVTLADGTNELMSYTFSRCYEQDSLLYFEDMRGLKLIVNKSQFVSLKILEGVK